jgi:hypothetical protein
MKCKQSFFTLNVCVFQIQNVDERLGTDYENYEKNHVTDNGRSDGSNNDSLWRRQQREGR